MQVLRYSRQMCKVPRKQGQAQQQTQRHKNDKPEEHLQKRLFQIYVTMFHHIYLASISFLTCMQIRAKTSTMTKNTIISAEACPIWK